MVDAVGVSMQVDRAGRRDELAQQHQTLEHELKVRVIAPDVGVLELFAEAVAFATESCDPSDSAKLNLADVVRSRVEGWVDVHQIDQAPIPVRQEVPEHVLVLAMEQEPAVGISGRPGGPVGLIGNGAGDCEPLDLLSRKSGHMAERPLPNP